MGKFISVVSPNESVSLTPAPAHEAVSVNAARTIQKHKIAIPRFSKNLFNMSRVRDIGSFISLSLAGQRRPTAPENFGFNGQPVAAADQLPLCRDILLEHIQAVLYQAFWFNITEI